MADKKKIKTVAHVKSETEFVSVLDEYKNKCKNQAELLVKDVFPRKVIEISQILDSEKFKISRMEDMKIKLNIPMPAVTELLIEPEENKKKRKFDHVNNAEINGAKVFSIPGGVVPLNQNLVEILDIVKIQAVELIEHSNQIKMWITFLVPKIEDGNNFGVSIQEDAIAEARQIETEAAQYLDQISRYFLMRGKIITKVAKNPYVEDFRRTVEEFDEKEFLSLRLTLTELRNHYASLHDIICKNLDKIKKPRSTNTDNMY